MKILGIPLSKPSFDEVTAAAVMASGLWLACIAIASVAGAQLSRVDAGGALIVVFWGCLCVRLGIRIERGPRHLAANLLCGGALLAAYQVLMTLFGVA